MASIYKIIEGTTYKLLETITYSKLNEITKSLLYIIEVLLTHIHSGNSVVDDGAKIVRSGIDTTTFATDGYGLIPVGGVIIWTGGNCPYGYISLDWNGVYLRSSIIYKTTIEGSNTHSHSIVHTHNYTINNGSSTSNHYHSGTGSASVTNNTQIGTAYTISGANITHGGSDNHIHAIQTITAYGVDPGTEILHDHWINMGKNNSSMSPITNTTTNYEPLSVNVTFCQKV